jgi:hypothetical protein
MMNSQWYVCPCGTMFRSPHPRTLCPRCSNYEEVDVGTKAFAALLALAITFGAICWVLW